MPVATDYQPNFNDQNQWVVHDDVDLFPEHQYEVRDKATGAVKGIERHDKTSLEEHAANCNRRDAMGIYCALAIGHTIDGAPEKQQPDIVGYARAFRVVWDDARSRWTIRARYYVKRDRYDEARQYPRSSVERHVREKFFDPISLIKRTPALDIPQWTYASRDEVIRYEAGEWTGEKREQHMPDMFNGNGGPSAPPSPAAAMPAQTPEDRLIEKMMAAWRSDPVYKYMCQKYQAESGPGMASGNNTFIPNGNGNGSQPQPPSPGPGQAVPSDEFERVRMSRDSAVGRVSRLEYELAAKDRTIAELQKSLRKAECEKDVANLEAAGYVLDRCSLVESLAELPPERRQDKLEEVKRYHRCAPVARGFIPTDALPNGFHNNVTPELKDRAVSILTEARSAGKKITWEDAVKQAKAA